MSLIESRFSALENGLNELILLNRGPRDDVQDGGFATAAEQQDEDFGAAPLGGKSRNPAEPKKAKARAKVPERVEPPPGISAMFSYPNLDPNSVAAALQAGIPEDQLQVMSEILGGKPKRLEDYPRPVQGDMIASEMEEEDALLAPEAAEDPNAQNLDPMSQALLKLTTIVSQLSKKKDDAEDLEHGVPSGGFGSADGSSNMGKKHAVVRQGLQKVFREDPAKLWKIMERNMQEDFNLQASLPNAGPQVFSARGWAEHRSRIGAFPRTVRAVWGVAGILDALRNNQIDSARTRACLMLAQFEQEAIDHGSFLLAQEFSMEPCPPISSFQHHSIPDPLEMSATRILQPGWIEAFADRLKQVDNYMEMRRKLNYKGKSGNQNDSQAEGKSTKGKSGGKGKAKSKKAEKSEEVAADN